jgi:hypothetical protein
VKSCYEISPKIGVHFIQAASKEEALAALEQEVLEQGVGG